jgi:hypothetical protein
MIHQPIRENILIYGLILKNCILLLPGKQGVFIHADFRISMIYGQRERLEE